MATLLVELVGTLLAEWTDGVGDRRVLAIGTCDLFYRLLVSGIGEFCTSRSPESDRDRAVGLLRELVAKQIAGRLAVGTWQREVVVRLLATPMIASATISQTTRIHTG